jgi:hypothetical protein
MEITGIFEDMEDTGRKARWARRDGKEMEPKDDRERREKKKNLKPRDGSGERTDGGEGVEGDEECKTGENELLSRDKRDPSGKGAETERRQSKGSTAWRESEVREMK